MNRNNWVKLLLFVLLTFTFYSCQKEEEVSTVDRDKFLGTWITQSNGTSGTLNFTMTISAGASSPNQIIIKNFDAEGSNTNTIGEISGSSISIAQQLVGALNDTIQGTGSYSSNATLSFSYTIRDGQTVDTRTASAHK